VKILLISTYELGRQPFGLASPASWLREAGHTVTCLDLSRQSLDEQTVRKASLIAFYVPMHTATRLTLQLLESLRRINPDAHFCAYGLYAPLAAESFVAAGVQSLFGGEFEPALVALALRLSDSSAAASQRNAANVSSMERLKFRIPDRSDLPNLSAYAHLVMPGGEHRTVGYTEASRGCKHLCRHCPVVPVYKGVFRIVDRETVLADIRQQVVAGAQHITFGDPDFFNGVGHAIPLVEALHHEFPQLTYDATIKVEHLRKHSELLRTLRATGCLFIVSAVESLDDGVLAKLEKGHTREDFFQVVEACRRVGLPIQPTFVSFTPWTTMESLIDMFEQIRRLGLIDAVAPIQLAIRLLIPTGSRLLDLEEVRNLVGPFDGQSLVFPWKHENPVIDDLAEELQNIVAAGDKRKRTRAALFEEMWQAVNHAANRCVEFFEMPVLASRATVPYLNEPWYC
jgi:radical SAM superfamily enzyme YgiQ (UPF0313 family)